MPLQLVGKLLPYGRMIGGAGMLVLLFVAGYQIAAWKYGLEIERARADQLEALNENKRLVAQIEQANQQLTDAIAAQAELRRQKNRVVERVVTEEVIKYVETDNARECGLSDAGVMLHDTAATGRVPSTAQSATGTDGRAIEATNAEVIRVVTDNYSTCNKTRHQLLLLQKWVRGIRDMESGQ